MFEVRASGMYVVMLFSESPPWLMISNHLSDCLAVNPAYYGIHSKTPLLHIFNNSSVYLVFVLQVYQQKSQCD